MVGNSKAKASRRRGGQAAVELALLMPFLCFSTIGGVDYARLVYALVTITHCARTGALYNSDTNYAASTGYATAQAAALADAGNLTPQPTANAPVLGTDAGGNSIASMTVTYAFTTFVTYPGIPPSTTLSRTVVMPVTPP